MIFTKPRMVIVGCLFLTACAHEQVVKLDSKAQSAESVSWPLLPMFEPVPEPPRIPTNPGSTEIAAAIEQTNAVPESVADPVKQHQVELSAEQTPEQTIDTRFKSPQIHPPSIKIPRAKNAESAYETPLIFDIPVAYNSRVKFWIQYFQTNGRSWYTKWLERSSRYLPLLQKTLRKNGLPQDLAYIAMIESGFSSQASSTAKAVGPWQFIRETGKRYGLKVTWWLDERRDFQKSTDAAAKYLRKMYGMFHNWYLVAAGYNTGEYRIKRLIEKNGTKNFWKMAQKNDLEAETRDYVPKLIAALIIAKAPQMYGFKNIHYNSPLIFDHFRVPGGTRLDQLAEAIGVTPKSMQELNPELVHGYVPSYVENHMIRIPKGSAKLVSHFVRDTYISER